MHLKTRAIRPAEKVSGRRRLLLPVLAVSALFLVSSGVLRAQAPAKEPATVPMYQDADQNTDSLYKLPLTTVIRLIESKFSVKIRYAPDLVKHKWVTYAFWRFRPTLEETFEKVLDPLDLKVNPDGDHKYELKAYEYYR